MTETWKPIDFIEGIDADRYEVSDHGRVRSWVNSRGNRRQTPRILAEFVTEWGYINSTLTQRPHNRAIRVHRLVAMAFIPNPEGKPHVAHNDGTKDNNHVSNLRWVTAKENEADKVNHGTSNRGKRNGHSKLSDNCVRQIRKKHAAGGVTLSKLASEYGVSCSLICGIINRKRWPHVSDTGASQ